MIMFFASVGLLILGYFLYGNLVDRLFGADPSRKTPAETLEDGVDYVQMPPWKIFLIQLLNIAGLGPIYGAILGALYGPVALVWIVFGCIFAGAVAVFVLWTAAVYLADIHKFHWIATIPAIFMTAVVTTFIANSTIGFNLPMPLATSIGIGAAAAATVAFFWKVRQISAASPVATAGKSL